MKKETPKKTAPKKAVAKKTASKKNNIPSDSETENPAPEEVIQAQQTLPPE